MRKIDRKDTGWATLQVREDGKWQTIAFIPPLGVAQRAAEKIVKLWTGWHKVRIMPASHYQTLVVGGRKAEKA